MLGDREATAAAEFDHPFVIIVQRDALDQREIHYFGESFGGCQRAPPIQQIREIQRI
jgi:hypothetical protein